MRSLFLSRIAVSTCLLFSAAGVASANIRITEYMYTGGANAEFIELTNIGTVAIDMTGWSFDDNSRTPGSLSLSPFGIVAPGSSVIVAETSEISFRAAWSLAPTIAVIGGNTQNFGRADEINIYNAANSLEDRLTYGDLVIPGSPRAQNASATTNPELYGANSITQWTLSTVGDSNGSYASTDGDVGNPGFAALPAVVAVPEPATYGLLLGGILLLAPLRNRRRK
ncbi:MAG: lamin tail domain-containing protein [Fibrella sp.]|nr:lamin tail domain-containing protein [Armatimonadota bacterium]